MTMKAVDLYLEQNVYNGLMTTMDRVSSGDLFGSLIVDLLGRVLLMTGIAVPAIALTDDSAFSMVYRIRRFDSFVWLYRLPS